MKKETKQEIYTLVVYVVAIIGIFFALCIIGSMSSKAQTCNASMAKIEITDGFMPTFKKIEKHDSQLEKLIAAFSKVESNGNQYAYNKKENSAGILAIRPIMVDEANRMLKIHDGIDYDYFTYDDRFDKSYSELIFSVIMIHKNPTLDLVRACNVWNKYGGERYIKKVSEAYRKANSNKNGKN